jgi:transposase InsO family protein
MIKRGENMLKAIKIKRHQMPKIGGRKIKYLLENQGDNYGRDKIFKLMKDNGLLVKRKKSYKVTTDSSNQENRYRNLIKGTEVSRADEIYLADITFIRLKQAYKYLSLVMDSYSRKIIGYSLKDRISVEGCIEAIRKATEGKEKTEGIIHHSDQGSQYSSNKYKEEMKSLGIKMSMSRKGNPYENAQIERVIGTLKREYQLGRKFTEENLILPLIEEAINSYNSQRPHMSLGYKTPNEVYEKSNGNFGRATPSLSYQGININ